MFGFSLPRFVTSIIRWVDAHATEHHDTGKDHQIDWIQSLPFFIMHLMCLGVFWVGWSGVAVSVALSLIHI